MNSFPSALRSTQEGAGGAATEAVATQKGTLGTHAALLDSFHGCSAVGFFLTSLHP